MHRTLWRRFRLLIGMTALIALFPGKMKCIDNPEDPAPAVTMNVSS